MHTQGKQTSLEESTLPSELLLPSCPPHPLETPTQEALPVLLRWSVIKAQAGFLLCPAHGGLREAFGVAHEGDGLAEVGGGIHYALPGLDGGWH